MQALQRPRNAHTTATHPTTLAQFVQTGIGSFGERRQEARFLVRTKKALPPPAMRTGLEGTRFATSTQQVL